MEGDVMPEVNEKNAKVARRLEMMM